MNALQTSDSEAAAVAVAPRVTLAMLEGKIAEEYSFTAGRALEALGMPVSGPLNIFTICVVVMQNGFVLLGESAPASPENYNEALGHKLAREQAIRKAWGFEGYALREALFQGVA